MREGLFETSSIFSKNNNNNNNNNNTTNNEEQVKKDVIQEEIPEYDLCKTLYFESPSRIKVESNGIIHLSMLFPDSLFCVIFNNIIGRFFVGHIKEELIFEVPLVECHPKLITSEIVVLSVKLSGESEYMPRVYMILKGNSYTIQDSFDYEIEGSNAIIDNKKYCMLTTEIKDKTRNDREDCERLHYKDINFVYDLEHTELFLENINDNSKLLLADQTGSYIGFYLKMDGNCVILQGKNYNMIKRLTLPLAIVQDVEFGNYYLLTCVTQVLHPIHEFYAGRIEDIPILNGIALFTDDSRSGSTLSVFTPKCQRIILEPKYKVNDEAFGNGLYFEKDNVLLLENGSLIFTERTDEDHVFVPKVGEVKIPIDYLGVT